MTTTRHDFVVQTLVSLVLLGACILVWLAIIGFMSAAFSAEPAPVVYPRNAKLLPPVEFDKPYTGKLHLTVLNSQDEMRKACPKAPFKSTALGCSKANFPMWGECTVFIVDRETAAPHNVSVEEIFRHEIGHCNGWPGDHPGMRPRERSRSTASSVIP